MKYLGVEEITTLKQRNNGTREFALPYKIRGKRVTLASYQSGYVSCLLYTSPSPRDRTRSRMPSSA